MKAQAIAASKMRQDTVIISRVIEWSNQQASKALVVVCAYNEAKSLPRLLSLLTEFDVLVIDDGSVDSTREIASRYGARVISHDRRLGKASSLADGLTFALENYYDVVVEVDGDTVPAEGALVQLLAILESPEVGGVSAKQIPIGVPNIAYHIDELMWAVLTEGKKMQASCEGSCHIGAVLVAFKPYLIDSIEGSVNDDEEVGLSIERKGYKTTFAEDAVAYFDASSCLGHIFERRRRMYYGHMKYAKSTAPSMQVSTGILSLAKAILESPSRSIWAIPALVMDSFARLFAWRDIRSPKKAQTYKRWVTSYAKNNILVIRNRSRR